jgi:hypothetical protein
MPFCRTVNRSEELESAPYVPIDADAILQDGLASLRDLRRLLESGNLEERKEFIRAFISGITVRPNKGRLDLMVNQLPSLNAKSSVGLVAGARYVPLQIEMRPMERFLRGCGGRRRSTTTSSVGWAPLGLEAGTDERLMLVSDREQRRQEPTGPRARQQIRTRRARRGRAVRGSCSGRTNA